jgi:hypothetical protein
MLARCTELRDAGRLDEVMRTLTLWTGAILGAALGID